jgi:hypothetical protein
LIRARIILFFTNKHKKQILLTKEQKKELLSELKLTEKSFSSSKKFEQFANVDAETLSSLKEELDVVNHRLKLSLRKFFLFIFSNNSFPYKQSAINHLPTSSSVKRVLRTLYKLERLRTLSPSENNKDHYLVILELKIILESLREGIFSLSSIEFEDVARSLKEERMGSDNFFNTYKKIYNSLLALQLEELDVAIKGYLSALKNYLELTELEKHSLYHQLLFLFNALRYKKSYLKQPKKK